VRGGPSTLVGKARVDLSLICAKLNRSPGRSLEVSAPAVANIRAVCPVGYAPAVEVVLKAFERGTLYILTDYEKAVVEGVQMLAHSQCEANQLVPTQMLLFLEDTVHLSKTIGFGYDDLIRWRRYLDVRKSLVFLLFAASESRPHIPDSVNKPFRLNADILSLFEALAQRVKSVNEHIQSLHERKLYDIDERPLFDPSQGQAYFFTSSGRSVASWPELKNDGRAESCESCDHPDWYKIAGSKMGEGILSVACLDSYTLRGFHFMLGHECKADAAAAVYCYSMEPPDSLTLDTPCQHSPYCNSRLNFYCSTFLFMGDRWHRLKHTCRKIFNPDDFRRFEQKKLSFIEQWHSLQMILKKMVAGATIEHAAFYACLLHDFHYNKRCDELGVVEERRHW